MIELYIKILENALKHYMSFFDNGANHKNY